MGVAARHPFSLVVVLAAVLATGGVFVFARPQYRPRYESKMIDFSKERYYSLASVRRAFASHGLRLAYGSTVSGLSLLSSTRPPFDADALQVAVAPRTGKGSWGPKLEPYDARFGNVLVTYGGGDEGILRRVEAAVADLR